jgi:histidine triad (HIT) family protein
MCLFCKIVANSIPVTRLYEDDQILAFADINPQAPTHILIIPKKHFSSLADTTPHDDALLGHLLSTTAKIAEQAGLAPTKNAGGYRIVINTGQNGGQTVEHLHLHLLGSRHMGWPPG